MRTGERATNGYRWDIDESMFYPGLEASLRSAKHALDRATIDNVIERCKQYLALLAEYRSQLYELPKIPGIKLKPGSASPADVESARRAVRVALENLTQEYKSTTALLLSFTAVSGYGAVETLNRRKYKDHDDWELKASGVRFSGGADDDMMTIQEAVDIAVMLRREEHIARNVDRARGRAEGSA